MKKTVAIIAPFIDTQQYHMDLTLRLKKNDRELTLAALYELASDGFKTENMVRGLDYSTDIPAAGYYLEGLLHQLDYDTVLTNRYDTGTIRSIASGDPFAVCISTTMIISAESLVTLVASIRAEMPDAFIIAGGSLLWKNYLYYIKHLEYPALYPLQPGMVFHPENAGMQADALVIAPHGRSTMEAVLAGLEKSTRPSLGHIPNLCLPDGREFRFTQREEENVDYNEDFTRWDLVDTIPEKIPVRTSIGCPYRCRYCDFCHLYPRIFLRSPESLAKELRLAKDRLGKNLALMHVTDDNVFINKKRLFEVCDVIEHSGLNHWVGFMRGGVHSDEEMEAIKRSGLMMGKIGVESGDQDQLTRMNKHQKVEHMKLGIEQFDAHGISLYLTFVVGFPGESQQTMQNTVDFLNNLELANLSVGYQLYPLFIFPLSELADPSTRERWKIDGIMADWSHYTMNYDQASRACYDMFTKITNVPYSYDEESFFFNKGMFTLDTRRALFQQRQQLTIKLIEKAPWTEIEPVFRKIAGLMEVPANGIGEHLKEEILAPDI